MGNGRVLVVDDDKDTLLSLKDTLELAGYAVETASNGAEALAQAQAVNPDLILLDVMMPGESGFSVCEKLKKMKQTETIPIIMLTAKSLIGDVEEALALGATSYIVKPFDIDDFLGKVQRYIRKRR